MSWGWGVGEYVKHEDEEGPAGYGQRVLQGGLAQAVADGVVLRAGRSEDAAGGGDMRVQVEDVGGYLDVLSVESALATWERAFDDKGLMSSARPSRVTTTASWLRGFWSKNSVMMLGMMSLGRVTCDV